MATLNLTDGPEEDVDVEEEEGVGQEKRVAKAPTPERREAIGAIAIAGSDRVFEEGQVEENGGERSEESEEGVPEVATHAWSRCIIGDEGPSL